MRKTVLLAFAIALMSGLSASASASEAQISNATMRVRLSLPDAQTGFYRGTRFDWSGVITGLEHGRHEYYPPWFQRTDANVHDFTYDGTNIVAGPCTAITGPAEEFVWNGKALGFDEAQPGRTFIKIGVGVLRRPDDRNYDPYRLYPIQDGGRWTIIRKGDQVEFTQTVEDTSTGYGYEYRKIVSVAGAKPELVLEHVLRNTGKRTIQTSVYNHNFLYLDRRAPGPQASVTVPFAIRTASATGGLVEIREKQIAFLKTLTGEEHVYLDIRGFGPASGDYDIRVEDRGAGAGVRITGDRPLSRLALWAIRAPLSIEPFIAMSINPGAEFTWRIKYEYYDLPPGAP